MVLMIGTHQWNRMRQSSVNESRDSICQVEATTTEGRWFRSRDQTVRMAVIHTFIITHLTSFRKYFRVPFYWTLFPLRS
jgi:hypothetical protein